MAQLFSKRLLRMLALILLSTFVLTDTDAHAEQPEATPAGRAEFNTTDSYDGKARPWSNLNFNNDPDDFQFAIMTDRTGYFRPGVFGAIVKKVNLLRPEFVMSVGDYIEGLTLDRGILEDEWAEFDALVAPLDAPLFVTPGNHDIANDVMEDIWTERSGRSHYHFLYKNVLFIVLNTEDPPYPTPEVQAIFDEVIRLHSKDRAAARAYAKANTVLGQYFGAADQMRLGDMQRDWALDVLNQHKNVRWTFIFMHRPIWRKPTVNFEAVEDALADRGYTMMAGHIHNYTHETRQGRDYISLGTNGGRWPPFDTKGAMDHITWVSMTDDGPVFANLVATGILEKDKIPDVIPGREFCGPDYGILCQYGDGKKYRPTSTPAEAE